MNRRVSSFLAAMAVSALVLAPSLADARAGFGGSMGSRGGRTFSAPPMTRTAPSGGAPFEQTVTPRQSPSYAPGYATPGYGSPMQGGRGFGGFGSGLLGGLLGAGIGGLLFGHGVFGGGGFGFIGLLLQLALIFFVGRWLLRTFMGRPAMAGMGSSLGRLGMPAGNPAGGGMAAAPVRRAAPQLAIAQADYQAFEQLLKEVQAAWSGQDLRRLQAVATPEMVGYFSDQLSQLSSRGLVNSVTDVRLDQGDLAEAWSEGNRDFATVAMRFSMVDVTRDSTGRVVDGDPNSRGTATELWTFMRAQGGRWILSAIQQTR